MHKTCICSKSSQILHNGYHNFSFHWTETPTSYIHIPRRWIKSLHAPWSLTLPIPFLFCRWRPSSNSWVIVLYFACAVELPRGNCVCPATGEPPPQPIAVALEPNPSIGSCSRMHHIRCRHSSARSYSSFCFVRKLTSYNFSRLAFLFHV